MVVLFGCESITQSLADGVITLGETGRVRSMIKIQDHRAKKTHIEPMWDSYSNVRSLSGFYPATGAKRLPYATVSGSIVSQSQGNLSLTDEDDESSVSLVISSHGHYNRGGGAGGVGGSIQILRRFSLQAEDFRFRFSDELKNPQLGKESISHVEILAVGNGAYGDAGNLGIWKAAVIKVPAGSYDAVVRVVRSGYPGRFKNTGSDQIHYLVVSEGIFDDVPESRLGEYFGPSLPWVGVGYKEFHWL